MKISLPAGFNVNIRNFLQREGYFASLHSQTGRLNFTKRLTSADYPHYHLYIEKNMDGSSYLTLHLDQKKPSYQGARAHNADYSGQVVEGEARRLQSRIMEEMHNLLEKKKQVKTEKKGFFNQIFGK